MGKQHSPELCFVTGAVAEGLGRKWITSELNAEYVEGSRFRFAS